MKNIINGLIVFLEITCIWIIEDSKCYAVVAEISLSNCSTILRNKFLWDSWLTYIFRQTRLVISSE